MGAPERERKCEARERAVGGEDNTLVNNNNGTLGGTAHSQYRQDRALERGWFLFCRKWESYPSVSDTKPHPPPQQHPPLV